MKLNITQTEEPTNSFEQLDLGKSKYQSLSTENAFYWLKLSAEQKNMEAQFRLGDLYALGHGQQQDETTAYDYYLQSAIQGYQPAIVRLHDLYNAEKNMYCRGQMNDSEEEWAQDDYKKKHHIRELNEYRVEQLEPVLTKLNTYFTKLLSKCKAQERQKKLDKQNAYLTLGFLYQHGYGIRKITSRAIEYYTLAAEQGNVYAQYNLANLYHQNPYIKWNYHQAVHWYRKAAESGNCNAQNNLADLYLKSLGGLELDYSRALYWYILAAGQRNKKAIITLTQLEKTKKDQLHQNDYKRLEQWYKMTPLKKSGTLTQIDLNLLHETQERTQNTTIDHHHKTPNPDPSNIYSKKNMSLKLHTDITNITNPTIPLKKLKQLAKHAVVGDGQAMFHIGTMYSEGDTFPKDTDLGFQWTLKAAKAGSQDALLTIASMYKRGDVTEQDYHRASIWYRRGSRQKCSQAQFELGNMYYQGLGVRKDALESSRWYTLSSIHHNSDAQCQLGVLRTRGEGLREDLPEALAWFIASAKQGNTEAIYQLAKVPNLRPPHFFYKHAARRGHVPSLLKLVYDLSDPDSPDYDIHAAFAYCQQAALQNDPQAVFLLGTMYLDGRGVPQDYLHAHSLFQRTDQLYTVPIDYSLTYNVDYAKLAILFELVCRRDNNSLAYNLGYFYEHGASYDYEMATYTLPPNYYLAKKWYKRSRDPRALLRIGVMYEEGKGVVKSRHKAMDYYTRAGATYRLASMYLSGYHTRGDFRKALGLLTEASYTGHPEAIRLLNEGEGVMRRVWEEGARSGWVVYQYRWAMVKIQGGKYEEAVKWLRMAAEKGLTEAYFQLGLIFEQGLGVKRDEQEAVRLFGLAGDHERALYRLAVVCHGRGEFIKAFWYYTRAAVLGSRSAQVVVDVKVKSAWLIEKTLEEDMPDYETCFELWEFVAERGNSDLQYQMGVLCEEMGQLDAKESQQWFLQASGWYFKASREDHTRAIYRLGYLYEMGLGVSRDYRQAIECYERAGKMESDEALFRLGVIYHHGHGVDVDLPVALGHYKNAAEKGNSQSQFTMGQLYERGEIVQKSLVKAVRWYVSSAKQEYDEAQVRLDELDQDITEDDLFYINWFKLLSRLVLQEEFINHSEQGSFLGSVHYNLGYKYYYGQGTGVDYKRAWKHFSKARIIYADSRTIAFSSIQYDGIDTSSKEECLKKLEMFDSVEDQLTQEELYELGVVYLKGIHTSTSSHPESDQVDQIIQPDFHKAIHYFKMITARENLDDPTLDDDVKKDPEEKTKWEATQRYFSTSYYLGIIHCIDIARKKDSTKAIYYMKNASISEHHSDANYILQTIQGDQSDMSSFYENVFEWHKANEDSRNPALNFNLGWMFAHGIGTEVNYEDTLYYLKRAAAYDYVEAFYELGDCYHFGHGTKKKLDVAIKWYLQAAAYNHDMANYNLALIHVSERDYKKAFEYYRASADSGNQDAQYELGQCYTEGEGVQTDDQMAMFWFEKAAKQGHVRANYQLGMICTGKRNHKTAFDYYKFAAEHGDRDGQFEVGYRYHEGVGVPKDLKKAVEWYTKAANQMESISNNNLGTMYILGEGVERNAGEAFKHYLVAAEQGYKDAQYQVGSLYQQGIGVKKDEKAAEEWFIKAAQQHHLLANFSLGTIYFKEDKEADNKAAIKHFKIAANQGNATAQFYLAEIYYYGYGVERDVKQAIEWFTRSADQNNVGSSIFLASIYISDEQLDRDIKTAFHYFKLSIDQGLGDVGYKFRQYFSYSYVFKRAYHNTRRIFSKVL